MSGRGIGLDIVRESIERLGGKVIFDSKRGAGTTFELILPPSLASMDALIVEAGVGGAASIPLDAVRGTLRVAAADISHGASGATVVYGNAAIPFMPLPSALGGAPWPASRNWTAIVVAGAMGMAALGVDRLLGTGPTIVRALPDGIAASAVVAGASLDSEGNPQLVIDPESLVAAAYRGNTGKL
jgi:two-component system chemotaxis sensor kinase CheA